MELWQILLIIGVGTVPFIVIAILVEAMAGNDEDDERRRRERTRRDGPPIVPYDFD